MRYRRTVLALVVAGLLSITTTGYGKDNNTSTAAVNGTQLYYEVKGQGHPLVFIHGGLISSSE